MKSPFGWLLAFVLAVSSMSAVARMDDKPLFSQAELDQMLAPIALYPDQLLSQILMAATYPLEVVQAARFQRSNPDLHGQEAVRAASGHDWDPSVQSLLAFPNVLQQMDADLDWTERLGDAFLAQQEQVMDTVQALRNRAYAAGNLRTNEQVRVVREREIIMVQPARSNLFYVPYYDPLAVYGSWWWPAYRPVYWNPWPGYGLTLGYANRNVIFWGSGINLGLNFFFGNWDWPTRRVRVEPRLPFYYRVAPPVHYVWVHDYRHRRGHPYRHVIVKHRHVPSHQARPVVRHDGYRSVPDVRYTRDNPRRAASRPEVIYPPRPIRHQQQPNRSPVTMNDFRDDTRGRRTDGPFADRQRHAEQSRQSQRNHYMNRTREWGASQSRPVGAQRPSMAERPRMQAHPQPPLTVTQPAGTPSREARGPAATTQWNAAGRVPHASVRERRTAGMTDTSIRQSQLPGSPGRTIAASPRALRNDIVHGPAADRSREARGATNDVRSRQPGHDRGGPRF